VPVRTLHVGGSTGGRAEFNSIMERHNGSSEERWSKKERRQKGRTQEDSKKGRTQRRKKGREKGHQETPLASQAEENEKAGSRRLFCFVRVTHHRE